MMADSIEHVISYWMMFQKFQSQRAGRVRGDLALGAVPVAVAAGRRARRSFRSAPDDSDRHVSVHGRVDRLGRAVHRPTRWKMWHAMVLLTLHGIAGVLWTPSSQVLLHHVVPARATAERRAFECDRASARIAGWARDRWTAVAVARAGERHSAECADLHADDHLVVEGAVFTTRRRGRAEAAASAAVGR